MKKQVLLALTLCLCCAALSGCKSKEKIDISTIHTTAAPTSEAARETMSETKTETTAPTSATQGAETAQPETKMETYKNGKISIQYPVISNLSDTSKQEKINGLLKENALSVLKGYEVQEDQDSLLVEAKIVSSNRKRIAVTYTGVLEQSGTAYPVNLFYSNAVDLNSAANVGLETYADAYTLAGYVASGDYKLEGADETLESSLRTYIADHENALDFFYAMFRKTDFTGTAAEAAGTFPESFSYENQGVVYVSIPVIHALGDYAILKYVPDNK